MKKIILIALLGTSINAFGQVHSIGIQAGINMTNLTADNTFKNSEYRDGIIGGFNYEFLLKGKYSFGADILYSQQGFKDKVILTDENSNPTGVSADSKLYYDYLMFPVKFGYTIGNKIKITPKIGISPSVLLKAETIHPMFDTNGNLTGYNTIDDKDKVSKFDLGGLIELGVGYGLVDNLELFSSITYRQSITTFSNSDYFKDSRMRHYGFSLTIGLKYKLNKK